MRAREPLATLYIYWRIRWQREMQVRKTEKRIITLFDLKERNNEAAKWTGWFWVTAAKELRVEHDAS